MIKTNDETCNTAKSVKCFSDRITSFFFKEDKVVINEKRHIGYLKIFIHHYKNLCFIYIYKKNISINRNDVTVREM